MSNISHKRDSEMCSDQWLIVLYFIKRWWITVKNIVYTVQSQNIKYILRIVWDMSWMISKCYNAVIDWVWLKIISDLNIELEDVW